jgi:hypothetical protein
MTINLMGVPFHFIENVDLVGATYEHLGRISDRCRGVL